ncbi:YlzJ-like family protein [Fictibacillus phosphorivorans]|uniref:YlzJ-like family protein n=1 Tax=Fictibacillus phosphorivorans TaxID=1221500 RepID=UPI00203F703A|nr:YlzJ-like family protein [Fictibacillus phosphorivorans]MCM3717102.1 YlzJ-like family protein [Fictibacillus phosphorivorans]MCM3774789.1 YlzJ-like family protein [Fictibacillus phosphorivorans]
MILYTMQPYELMFPEEGNNRAMQNVILYNNVPVLVERDGEETRIVQIMSTDPSHYLLEDCQPGMTLRNF